MKRSELKRHVGLQSQKQLRQTSNHRQREKEAS